MTEPPGTTLACAAGANGPSGIVTLPNPWEMGTVIAPNQTRSVQKRTRWWILGCGRTVGLRVRVVQVMGISPCGGPSRVWSRPGSQRCPHLPGLLFQPSFELCTSRAAVRQWPLVAGEEMGRSRLHSSKPADSGCCARSSPLSENCRCRRCPGSWIGPMTGSLQPHGPG
jgi:hypothetical protein